MSKLLGKRDPEVCVLVPLNPYLRIRLHMHRLKQRQVSQRIIQETADLNTVWRCQSSTTWRGESSLSTHGFLWKLQRGHALIVGLN